MNRRAAELIVPMLVNAAGEIAATMDIYRAHEPESQAQVYSEAVGQVFFKIDDLLRPFITQYPDLHP